MIPVTKTFFPEIEKYQEQLKRIWENQWLTNRGELLEELEGKLKLHLQVSNIILTTNGTLPIQIAIKALAEKGEIITTPFSYIATTSAIVWENCKPIFVDIHPDYLTIDETKIEAAITPQTTAILATHVFGNPCNIEEIERIALKYDLKVIYDAAHCFDVLYKNKSIFGFGDVSVCSFHATKLFHTGEGGAMFCNDNEVNQELFYSHNFGHNGPGKFQGLGINAKMSELQAAMGLAVLPHIEDIINSRKGTVDFYNNHLDFSHCRKMKIRSGTKWNYSYYPVIFENETKLLEVVQNLNNLKIFPRRYFYPSLNTLDYVEYTSMPFSENISMRILCLPLYYGIEDEVLNEIVQIINRTLKQ